MSIRNLEALLAPASVAIIGVPERSDSLGMVVARNLLAGGFKGPIWLVDHHKGSVLGQATFADVASLPQAPDLALICTPAPSVPGLIEALGRKGTRAACVLSAGMRQTNGTVSLEQAMLDAARPYLLRILGPNCLGLLVPGIGLNASFAPGNALAGKLAFITQSGALATAMLDWASSRGIGFSHFLSVGDTADVDFGDLLDYLASDPNTRAILMYMESVKASRKFMSAARAAARNKPVIVVKAGRAPSGAKAAASHTGAMAGSDAVFDAAVRRAGMLRVDTLESLFDAAETLSCLKPWRGERLAVLTNGGGAGVLAADALAQGGGVQAELSTQTLAALDGCLPTTWPRSNPVDIIGDAPVARYRDALQILLAAPEVDGVLFMHAPTAIVRSADIADACLPLMAKADKPVLACWLGGAAVEQARQSCRTAGVASYDTPERAIAGWLQRATYAHNQEALLQLPSGSMPDFRPDLARARALMEHAAKEGHEWLDEEQAKNVLKAYGIPVVETRRVRDAQEAVDAAELIGYPVALKIVSPQIVHKSDVGGVALGLTSAEEVRGAAVRMRQRVAHAQPQAHVAGFTVQAMAHRAGAHELIVGVASDPMFGPVVLFGEGGTAVELRKDRAVALPPLNETLAAGLIAQTHVASLLAGYRGHPAVDQQALIGTILKVSQLACDLPELAELDINPLLADAQGVLALDARIRLRQPKPGEPSRLAVRPYPTRLEEMLNISGQDLQVRPIRPEDGTRLADFYADASPADMRLRFFMVRREVSHSELARYCQIDYEREMTFIAMAPPVQGQPQAMVGEVRAICDPDNVEAEFALQVATAWQGRGLGRALLDKMLRYLRERGTSEVTGQCLVENKGMAAIARHAGFEMSPGPASDTVSMRLRLLKA